MQPMPIVCAGDWAERIAGAQAEAAASVAAASPVFRKNCRRFKFMFLLMAANLSASDFNWAHPDFQSVIPGCFKRRAHLRVVLFQLGAGDREKALRLNRDGRGSPS